MIDPARDPDDLLADPESPIRAFTDMPDPMDPDAICVWYRHYFEVVEMALCDWKPEPEAEPEPKELIPAKSYAEASETALCGCIALERSRAATAADRIRMAEEELERRT